MSTDWRALCAELVEQLERYQSDFPPKTDKMAHRAMAADAVLARACAALTAEADGPAVPEGREPASVVSEPSDEDLDVLADEWLDWNIEGHRAFARAAIAADRARYRHHPAPPAEGEQRHPTPVPMAERLPGASHVYFEFVISDADDCTQAGGIAPTYAQALSEGQHYLAQYQQDGPHTLELRRVEVLPPGALPLPQGEVE